LKNARARTGKALMRGEPSRVFAEFAAAAACFNADHFHVGVAQN